MQALVDVVVSRAGFEDPDPYALIESNVSVVNLARAEGLPDALIAPSARQSYWVDYYRAQMLNGGFGQFVFNSQWQPHIIRDVADGLAAMAGPEHLAYWRARVAVVAGLAPEQLTAYLAMNLFGDNPVRELLDDNAFFAIHRAHDLVAANHEFLRSLSNLRVLEIDDMFLVLEAALGRTIER